MDWIRDWRDKNKSWVLAWRNRNKSKTVQPTTQPTPWAPIIRQLYEHAKAQHARWERACWDYAKAHGLGTINVGPQSRVHPFLGKLYTQTLRAGRAMNELRIALELEQIGKDVSCLDQEIKSCFRVGKCTTKYTAKNAEAVTKLLFCESKVEPRHVAFVEKYMAGMLKRHKLNKHQAPRTNGVVQKCSYSINL